MIYALYIYINILWLLFTIICYSLILNSESVGFQSLGPGTGDTKSTPRKTGRVLEPCWNLSLLCCKAGRISV
jgi:hypothetical protein